MGSDDVLSTRLSAGTTLEYADNGYGELAILMALTHPDATIVANITDPERLRIARIAADGFVDNIEFKD